MKVLYFDCFAGAAGDMILGALVDAGVPIEALQQALGSLAVEGCEVTADRVVKHGIRATKFRVHAPAAGPAHGHFHLSEIRAAIERSALSVAGKARANRLFTRLAEAEAALCGERHDGEARGGCHARRLSSTNVTGPSFSRVTRIAAWNSPVSTGSPAARRAVTTSP